MDGLCVVPPAPIIPFSINQSKYLRSIWHTFSANSVAETNFPGFVGQRCFTHKSLPSKCLIQNVSSCSCSMWSDILPGITDATRLYDNCKVPRRKSKKKAKKKRKQSKKPHSDVGLVVAEVLSTHLSNEISTTEPFADDDMELDVSAPSAADLVDYSSGIYDRQAVGEDHSCGFSNLNEVGQTFLMYRNLDLSGGHAYETEEFVHVGAANNRRRQQIKCFDRDTEVSYENNDSLISGSGLTGLDSVDSRNTICDVPNGNNFICAESSTVVVEKDSSSSESSSILSADFDTRIKRRDFGSKEISSVDRHMHTKRGKNVNSMSGRCANKGNAHRHFGNENICSVWKKVHKVNTSDLSSMNENSNLSSELGVTPREQQRHERYCNVAMKLSAADDLSNFEVKVSQRPRNRNTLELQRKAYIPSRKEYLLKNQRSSIHVNVNLESNRSYNGAAPKKFKHARGLLCNSSRGALHASKVDLPAPTSVPGLKLHPKDLLMPETIFTSNGNMDAQNPEVKYSLLAELDASTDLPNSLDQVPSCHPVHKENDVHMEKEALFATNGKKDGNSGFVLQKWLPVGRKVPCPTGLERSDTSLLLHFDKFDSVNECSAATTDLSAESVSSITSEAKVSSPIFEKLHDSESVPDISPSKATTMSVTRKLESFVNGVEESHLSLYDASSKELTIAVEDIFSIQMESEDVRGATGAPTVGFEKFLHSASPVIIKLDDPFKRQLCHTEPAAISFSCTHEMPNLSLKSLWGWYERHGSYGLEVREDRYSDPTKLGHREYGLRAYFVPYLSAVQLFRTCRSCFVNGLKCLHPGIPCPGTEAVRASPSEQSSISDSYCGSVANDTTVHSAVMTGSLELIFEYFESEQPRRRQPLFEKIKELIEGGSLQKNIYGDPTILSSCNMHDLHPRSWYSVAWYPIYRIPDGNFRAAFLTYHSLGHLAHRVGTSNSSQVEIISPIVGLLSCNAQCEGWFQSMESKAENATDTKRFIISETIEERLKTLEHMATEFATSTVSKGNITSVNKHPDYDFFTSRRR